MPNKYQRKYPKEIVGTRLYRIWNGMKARCYTPGTEAYKKYGAKGITVCDEWRNDFRVFYDWALNNGYSDELQIDRIDFRGNYEPSNCRWVNLKQQANNKSNVNFLTYNGETKTISEWSEITHISPLNIWQRIKKLNWTVEKALTTPERFIDNTRAEADTRIIKRELRYAAKEHICNFCCKPIFARERYSYINVSKNFSIMSIKLHLNCEEKYISNIIPECGINGEVQWKAIKERSELGKNSK